MAGQLVQDSARLFEQLMVDIPGPDGPRALHMDFRPGNVLIWNGKITGLIDLESARGGSADMDFTKMKIYVWDRYPGTKDAFLSADRTVRSLPSLGRPCRSTS